MQIIETLDELELYLDCAKTLGKSIGFVPTMGALHRGHASLIEASKAQDDLTICSIFVNPTQFNEASDLEKYPRTPERDALMLQILRTDVLFLPEASEIYPESEAPIPDFRLTQLANVLEGHYRPGHFDGVIQVMYRLLTLMQADRVYMGLKDFQQQAIIAAMLEQMEVNTALVPCPIIREVDGLAMSSRNMRLTKDQRTKLAPMLHETLLSAKKQWDNRKAMDEIQKAAISKLEAAGFKVDYFEMVNAKTLQPASNFNESTRACVAAWLGEVRLIDNFEFA
ncbi:MAG: pantoate--beta-alanine ligase [Bacteroidota bacterium]